MNFKELFEGVEPKLPGAPEGIQIMTPQQFVAKAGDMPGEESEEGVAEGEKKPHPETWHDVDPKLGRAVDKMSQAEKVKKGLAHPDTLKKKGVAEGYSNTTFNVDRRKLNVPALIQKGAIFVTYPHGEQGWETDNKEDWAFSLLSLYNVLQGGWPSEAKKYLKPESYRRAEQQINSSAPNLGSDKLVYDGKYNQILWSIKKLGISDNVAFLDKGQQGVAEGKIKLSTDPNWYGAEVGDYRASGPVVNIPTNQLVGFEPDDKMNQPASKANVEKIVAGLKQGAKLPPLMVRQYKNGYQVLDGHHRFWAYKLLGAKSIPAQVVPAKDIEEITKQGVAEGEEHLARIRKLSGLEEATKLPAQSREFGGQEFQDYMNRIVGTPDIDKKTGQVKTDKKGGEKYVSGKTKADRYKMPYIHRSSVITYLSPDGKTYDEEAVKKTLSIRPKALLKQNEKMKHSNGEFEQFFNVGFAALTGIALDEETNKLIIVNTCPGAGSCKVDCFAMKGGKVQFQGPWQSDGRILTYLLNDPDGFFNQLSAEITKESVAGKKGDKKFPNGWQTTVRWHDAGDFFSPEYLDMALKMAAKHPDVKFYAYTKMAGAALAKKPANFIINWSEGAHTSQEKQVKASDANLDTTKNSRIVPDELFQDLLVKDEKKNLVKGEQGQWQVQPDKLPELKQRLAREYGLSANSILDYNEYMAKRKSIPAGMKYNVIVAPGEGDISANDPNIISTLLLKH